MYFKKRMKNRTLIFESGQQYDQNYTVADVKAIADNYSEQKYSAPITFGHETKSGDPAAGWIRKLEVEVGEDGIARLYADSDFNKIGEDAITSGKFENKSISLYTPDSKFNPNPGSWSIRHLAILGAEPPAIKTLGVIAEVEYAEEDTVFVSYACSCQTKPPTTVNLQENPMNVMKELKKLETPVADEVITEVVTEDLAEQTPEERIAELEAELAALKATNIEVAKEEIAIEEVELEADKKELEEEVSELEALKMKLAEMQSELEVAKEANTALTISSAVGPYYSEGIITEDLLPEATLTNVITKLTLGHTSYSENETPLEVIEALMSALTRAVPSVEYGETWPEALKETEVVKSVSYSDTDSLHELTVATAHKYTMSYGKAMTAIVKAKEISDAKSVDFSETLISLVS
jgi:cytochrome c553